MRRAYLTLLLVAASASTAGNRVSAQTLPSGVISAPPTVIGDNESIGTNTTLNVLDGGVVGDSFSAGLVDQASTDVVVNISGGTVGELLNVASGSEVHISGGTVGRRLRVIGGDVNISGGVVGYGLSVTAGKVDMSGGSVHIRSDGVATLRGGVVGNGFSAHSTGIVEFHGGEFKLDGVPYTGDSFSTGVGSVFTGTFADGTPFLFSNEFSREILQDVTLVPSSLPPTAVGPIVVGPNSNIVTRGLREGESLILQDGGRLGDDFAAIDATLRVEGGVVGSGLEFAGSSVTVGGGEVGPALRAYAGSELRIHGGSVGERLGLYPGSTLRLEGGAVGSFARAYEGSTLQISGGYIGEGFSAYGAGIELIGGSFELNGLPITTPPITLSYWDTVSGVLADGSPILMSGAELRSTTILLTPATPPPVGAAVQVVDEPSDPTLGGLRPGQSVILRGEGTLAQGFTALDATVVLEGGQPVLGMKLSRSNATLREGSISERLRVFNGSKITMSGGSIGERFLAQDSSVSINGGVVGADFESVHSVVLVDGGDIGDAFVSRGGEVGVHDGTIGNEFVAYGSTVSISGGAIGSDFDAKTTSIVNVNGGSIGQNFRTYGGSFGSTVNIRAGQIGAGFHADYNSVVNMIGGSFDGRISLDRYSEMNLVGTAFSLNGEPIESSTPGVPITISERDFTLTGTLADGSPFDFSFSAVHSPDDNYFAPDATLTLTLVPDTGDYNGDGLIDAADYGVWAASYGEEVIPYSRADGNGDGIVDAADYSIWRDNLPTFMHGVPEPSALLAAVAALLMTAAVRW